MKLKLGIFALALFMFAGASITAQAEEAPERMEHRSAFDPGSGLFSERSGDSGWFFGSERVSTGAPLADSDKFWVRSDKDIPMPKKAVEDGREFRLKVRELADRLLEVSEPALIGRTIVPVSFVSTDNFDRSSSFGKLVSEQLISEFNRRGLKVKEYRTRNSPEPRPGSGEFVLTRQPAAFPELPPDALVLAGTYYFDQDNVFINARLFESLDGMVLTAASMVLPQSRTTRTMLARGGGLHIVPAETEIKSFSDMADKSTFGFLFNEEDLH